MKTLKEMNLGELKALLNDHIDTYAKSGCEEYRQHAITVQNEIHSRIAEVEVNEVEIKVYFQLGYRWSVDINTQEESVVVNVTKAEAMKIARALRKENGGRIIEQKLTKEEKAENISYLMENSSVYGL